MKVFCYEPDWDSRQAGLRHGEEFRPMIRELVEIRTELCLSVGRFRDRAELRAIAQEHMPVLKRFDQGLTEELVGISEGAGVSEADIVVLNHYTDLRDIDPGAFGGTMGRPTSPAPMPEESHKALRRGNEEGCSVVSSRSPAQQVLGQTWDMHGSAEPYVMMLGIPEGTDASGAPRPAAWVFTLTGCLALAGMNRHGVAVMINNLRSVDAGVGVVWPAFVRKLLAAPDHATAKAIALDAPIGSGHHYIIGSPDNIFAFETSGALRETVFTGERGTYVHTNHCLDASVAERTVVPDASTTRERYRRLAPLEGGPPLTVNELWTALGSHAGYPRSVCSHMASPSHPHGSKTCGGLVVDLGGREALGVVGCMHHALGQRFAFDGTSLACGPGSPV